MGWDCSNGGGSYRYNSRVWGEAIILLAFCLLVRKWVAPSLLIQDSSFIVHTDAVTPICCQCKLCLDIFNCWELCGLVYHLDVLDDPESRFYLVVTAANQRTAPQDICFSSTACILLLRLQWWRLFTSSPAAIRLVRLSLGPFSAGNCFTFST